MQRKVKFRMIHIYLALLLVLVVGVFVYGIMGNETPDDDAKPDVSADENQVIGDPGIYYVGAENADTEEAPDEEEPTHIILTLEDADISIGYLVLVNHEHSFEIPENPELSSLLTERTGEYSVLGANHYFRHSIIPKLDALMAAYTEETGGTRVAIISAFRGLEAQQAALDEQIARLGREEALRWVALPGHSEHHTGLAVDLGLYVDGERRTFTGSGITVWFRENAHRFGFILRYPDGSFEITRTAYEPWHFRYIGAPHSVIVFENEWLFEEYIDYIRNYTIDEPFIFVYGGTTYEIFFTDEREIHLPLDSLFEVSGNNVDGFIVTVRG
ncbi:MAG: M15 family metallopeptidase [Oscillospiraceae bacterium]|nr:M15 family metallopeptidase [Oscillospiraceae bacterium]MCL2280149.1 M15 family metallopeptidase [Oscillospiraceae bacterium]